MPSSPTAIGLRCRRDHRRVLSAVLALSSIVSQLRTPTGGLSVMIVAFSVTPIGAGEDVGEIVAEAVRVVRASGLPNRTDAMFTTVEGE